MSERTGLMRIPGDEEVFLLGGEHVTSPNERQFSIVGEGPFCCPHCKSTEVLGMLARLWVKVDETGEIAMTPDREFPEPELTGEFQCVDCQTEWEE